MDILDKCSILIGERISDDECVIAVTNDGLAEQRQQHSIPLLHVGGQWRAVDDEPVLPWVAAGVVSIRKRPGEVLIVGWGGQAVLVRGGSCHREALMRNDSLPVSIIRSVCEIDGAVYAAGMGRQVYERADGGRWAEIDRGMVSLNREFGIGLNAIEGFSRGEIYAAGTNGELWHYDGHRWRKIEVPVNVHLHSLCCAADGNVYVGGRSGVLLKGRLDSWDVLDTGIDSTLWSVDWFRDALVFVAGHVLYRYASGDIERVSDDLLKDDLTSISSDQAMWVFGRKKIFRFEGSAWSEFPTDVSGSALNSAVIPFIDDSVLNVGSDYLND